MVGADGFTPFRRLKVRKFGTPLAGFGERVWLRKGEQVQPKVRRGKVAWVLPQILSLRCGGL